MPLLTNGLGTPWSTLDPGVPTFAVQTDTTELAVGLDGTLISSLVSRLIPR